MIIILISTQLILFEIIECRYFHEFFHASWNLDNCVICDYEPDTAVWDNYNLYRVSAKSDENFFFMVPT